MAKTKCVAFRDCQARLDDGKIMYFASGDVGFFDECPPHFTPADEIKSGAVDFMVVKESVLLDNNIVPLEDIVTFYKGKWGDDLSMLSRKDVVANLIYNRSNPMSNMGDGQVKAPLARDFKAAAQPATMNNSGIDVEFEASETPLKVPDEKVKDSEEVLTDDLDALLRG